MGYATPKMETLSFLHDFGAGTRTIAIPMPNGKQGRFVDAVLNATETFTATTLSGKIQVGVSGTLAQFATVDTATTAAGAALRLSDTTDAVVDLTIDAGTAILLTLTAPTGGTPAGIGEVHVSFDWF